MGSAFHYVVAIVLAFTPSVRKSASNSGPPRPTGGIAGKYLDQSAPLLSADERGKGPDVQGRNLPRASGKNTASVPKTIGRTSNLLDWLKPAEQDNNLVKVRMDKSLYKPGDAVRITVMMNGECNLAVLALGSGGIIDVLYPNRDQVGVFPLGGTVALPSPGGSLGLFIRENKSKGNVDEKVVAFCLPVDRTVFEVSPSLPTLALMPDSKEIRLLESLRPEKDRIHTSLALYRVEGRK